MLRAWPRKQRPEAAAPHGASAWLGAPRADFWVVAAGGGTLLIALALVLQWRGDRELSAADVLLGELHLGATYEAIVRRRLWRRMPLEVLAMPLAIMAATYLLMLNGGSLLVTTAVLCLGAWHRGRQNLGIARYYQRHAGGPVSPTHRWLLGAAFYLPMIAAVAYYASTAPTHEGEEFHGLSLAPELLWGLAGAAAVGVIAYLGWTAGRTTVTRWRRRPSRRAVAGPGQCAGLRQRLRARRLDLVVRARPRHSPRGSVPLLHLCRGATSGRLPGPGDRPGSPPARAVRAVAGDRPRVLGRVLVVGLDVLGPFLTAGLLGHYWLDGRIWTARARSLGSR